MTRSTHPGAFSIGGDSVDFAHIRVINELAGKLNISHDAATEMMDVYLLQGLTLAEVIHQHRLDMES